MPPEFLSDQPLAHSHNTACQGNWKSQIEPANKTTRLHRYFKRPNQVKNSHKRPFAPKRNTSKAQASPGSQSQYVRRLQKTPKRKRGSASVPQFFFVFLRYREQSDSL